MHEVKEKYNLAVKAYDNKNFEEAYTIFLSLAMQGDIDSQKMLANMLIHGIGTVKDEKDGYRWYLKAAESGDAEAQYWTAMHDFENNNYDRGLRLLHLSAKNAFPDAIFWSGNIYMYGLYSTKVNIKKAQEFYQKAIRAGVKDAAEKLFEAKIKEVGKVKAFLYYLKNLKIFIHR